MASALLVESVKLSLEETLTVSSLKEYLAGIPEGLKKEVNKSVDDIVENWEAATLLTFSGVGISSVLYKLIASKNASTLVRSKMLIPVLATLCVMILTESMNIKTKKGKKYAKCSK